MHRKSSPVAARPSVGWYARFTLPFVAMALFAVLHSMPTHAAPVGESGIAEVCPAGPARAAGGTGGTGNFAAEHQC